MNIMYENKKKNLNRKFINKQEMCLLMFAFVQNIIRTKNISQKIMSMTYAERKKNLNKKFINKQEMCLLMFAFV